MKYRLHDLLEAAHAIEIDDDLVLYSNRVDRAGRVSHGTFVSPESAFVDKGDYTFDPNQMVDLRQHGFVDIQATDDSGEDVTLCVTLLKMVPWTDEDMK